MRTTLNLILMSARKRKRAAIPTGRWVWKADGAGPTDYEVLGIFTSAGPV
jgi:hypothetical protein